MRASVLLLALVALVAAAVSVGVASADDSRPRVVLREDSDLLLGATACAFNGQSGSCAAARICNGTSVQSSLCASTQVCCIEHAQVKAGCGTAAVQRAMQWVNVQLQYCQAPNGQRDYDTDCSPYCKRASNPHWDSYRSDCSGLVSFAYGLPAPGRSTPEFAPFKTDVSRAITAGEMVAGDPMNKVPKNGHIVLFVRWLNEARTRVRVIEEPGCSSSTPFARVTDTECRVNADGTVWLASDNHTFQPIRMKSNEKVC